MRALPTAIAAICILAGITFGQTTVLVTQNISTSTTWTADNIYNLQQQIYVLPGATLTIEAGTVIASTTGLGGSLAVTNGAQIFVQGTQTRPVIMTSQADLATWTNGDPSTGTWRESANEWGNLTIMGDAYISEDATAGNSATPSSTNVAAMEGLIAAGPGDTNVLYGGGDDDDDSGSIKFLSIRYGGRVIALNDELNGLSLGGLGRETDISHVEIMNNVDDGIEIWGGTVGIKNFSIWNIGDDSFDVDQGWRGKAQFGLIVQGYSLDASQGSGVGDNCLEFDGAENSDWQPVTTTTLYNCTVIGQPVDGDGLTAWRDNARVQYRNCIFMDCGERVVRFDNLDGDGAQGYGFNGTLSWPNTWTTAFSNTSGVNAPANPGAFYTTQASGNLCEITDSVFFNNMNGSAYTEANARGVFAAANNNVMEPTNSPITSIGRAAAVLRGGKVMQQVTSLDPRPANDALVSAASAPADGFFTPANYRGAFAPNGENWLRSWTAADAFGFLANAGNAGDGQPGDLSAAALDINEAHNANDNPVGDVADPNGPHFSRVPVGSNIEMTLSGEPNQAIILLSGPLNSDVFTISPAIGQLDVGVALPGPPFVAATIVADGNSPGFFNSLFNTGPTGSITLSFPNNFPPSSELNFQALIFNSGTVIRTSNAVKVTTI